MCAGLSSSNRLCSFLRALTHLDLTLIRIADTNYYHPLSGKGSSLDVSQTALDIGLSRTGTCFICGWEGALIDTGERAGLSEGEAIASNKGRMLGEKQSELDLAFTVFCRANSVSCLLRIVSSARPFGTFLVLRITTHRLKILKFLSPCWKNNALLCFPS